MQCSSNVRCLCVLRLLLQLRFLLPLRTATSNVSRLTLPARSFLIGAIEILAVNRAAPTDYHSLLFCLNLS